MTRLSWKIRIFVPAMLKFNKIIAKTLSFRLSVMVIAALATLLLVALLIVFFFSRKAVKEEALHDAGQTLEATVQHIDNILLSVEQSAGNIYWKMINHISQPDKTQAYLRKLVEVNPYITDCHIIMDNDTEAIDVDIATWTDPSKEDSCTTFYLLPIYQGRQKVGVLKIDVSLTQMSKIVLAAKPSPNSYCTLLGRNGSFIVHPDSNKLNQNVFEMSSKSDYLSIKQAAHAMVAGEAGYRQVTMQGEDYYVFFKPFERADVPGRVQTNLGWSAGIVYPENDIFGDYNRLLYIVLVIAVVGLLLLLILCRIFIHRLLLPLRLLAKSAQRIADGYYDETIPDSRQQDEVGRLQNHFKEMQRSLTTHVGELRSLTDTLQKRGEELQAAYDKAHGAERMKTNFLYNMSDEMMSPASEISQNVKTVSDKYTSLSDEATRHLVENIRDDGDKITALLNQLIANSEKIMKD